MGVALEKNVSGLAIRKKGLTFFWDENKDMIYPSLIVFFIYAFGVRRAVITNTC